MEDNLKFPKEVKSAITAVAIAFDQDIEPSTNELAVLEKFCNGNEEMGKIIRNMIAFESAHITLTKKK